jgi:hypothetical protein
VRWKGHGQVECLQKKNNNNPRVVLCIHTHTHVHMAIVLRKSMVGVQIRLASSFFLLLATEAADRVVRDDG